MRKAGGLMRTLLHAKRAALPGDVVDLATDWGPDILMGSLYAASLPNEYASAGEKLGVAAEDSAIGITGSMLGRAVVTAAALPFVKPHMARQIGQYAGGMGGGMVASMFSPRPFMGSIDKRMQEQASEQQRMRDEALIAQGVRMGADGLAQSHPVQAFDYLLGGYG